MILQIGYHKKCAALADRPSASRMARLLCDEVSTDKFHPVAFPGGSELIVQLVFYFPNDWGEKGERTINVNKMGALDNEKEMEKLKAENGRLCFKPKKIRRP